MPVAPPIAAPSPTGPPAIAAIAAPVPAPSAPVLTARHPDRHRRYGPATRDRFDGRHRGSGRPLLGSADPAQPCAFRDRRRPHAKAPLSRLWHRQEGGGLAQRRFRAPRAWKADAIVRAADEAIA